MSRTQAEKRVRRFTKLLLAMGWGQRLDEPRFVDNAAHMIADALSILEPDDDEARDVARSLAIDFAQLARDIQGDQA